jgi:hypothetical protein
MQYIELYSTLKTKTRMSKKPQLKSHYRVHYFVDADGTWYEKNAPFQANNTSDAESQFRETMKLFPETIYRINYTEAL